MKKNVFGLLAMGLCLLAGCNEAAPPPDDPVGTTVSAKATIEATICDETMNIELRGDGANRLIDGHTTVINGQGYVLVPLPPVGDQIGVTTPAPLVLPDATDRNIDIELRGKRYRLDLFNPPQVGAVSLPDDTDPYTVKIRIGTDAYQLVPAVEDHDLMLGRPDQGTMVMEPSTTRVAVGWLPPMPPDTTRPLPRPRPVPRGFDVATTGIVPCTEHPDAWADDGDGMNLGLAMAQVGPYRQ